MQQQGNKHKQVLVVMSSSDQLVLKSGKSQETGFFLLELMYTVDALMTIGYDVVFTNAKGSEPHMDPLSDKYVWYLGNIPLYNRHKDLLEKIKQEKNFTSPRRFESWTDSELEKFDALFIPGGHAPMMDLTNNKELGAIVLHFHEKNKFIATICHGPAALLSARLLNEEWIFKGYAMTCYSNREEKMNELMWWDLVDQKLEDQLIGAGAQVRTNWPLVPHVIWDRELITGQGPSSVPAFTEQFIKALTSVSPIPTPMTPASLPTQSGMQANEVGA